MGKARGLLEQELQLPAGGLKPSKALCAEVIDQVMWEHSCHVNNVLREDLHASWQQLRFA